MDSGQVGPVPGLPGRPGPERELAGLADGPAGISDETRPEHELAGLAEPGAVTEFAELEFAEPGDEPCAAAEVAGLDDESCSAEEAPDTAGEASACRAREVLQRVGDKWSVYVIDLLRQDTKRFTELHRSIDGITARMLTVTLRGLERDGIVTRTIHPVIPPRVDYALTPMGRTLLDTISQLVTWADSHLSDIEAARAAYDAKHQSH